MAERDDRWEAALDDLEARLTAAEQGDLPALSGWTAPGPAGYAPSADRALRILARQETLVARLRVEQSRAAAAIVALRRPRRASIAATPVYIDRAL